MRALFVLHVDPFWPKPSLRALREAETLAHEGWDVSFLSWIIDPSPPATGPSDPYPVTRIQSPVPRIGTSLIRRGLAYNRATDLLRQGIVNARPDLIVAHDLLVLRASVAARRTLQCPLLYDCHENWPPLVAENSRLESILTEIQERRLARKVSHLLIPCEPVAQKFRAWGVPTTVIVNSRPIADIVLSDRAESRRSMGYDGGDFVLGFAGALASGRGLEILLDAMRPLSDDVKALIVGGPESAAQRLRDNAAELGLSARVRIDGYQSFSDLSRYYAAMDIGLILLDPRPNHLTALPNKLFDYMAHGVPVIVPDYPAMAQVVREGRAGWTLHPVAPEPVAAAIEGARRSGEATARGQNGRQAFLENYAWDHQLKTFLNIVSSLNRKA